MSGDDASQTVTGGEPAVPGTSTPGRPLSDDDYRALASFRHGLRRFLRFSEEAARAAGLTPAQHQLLLAVRGHRGEGAPTIGDVAEGLQQRLHSAGELVGRTVANGYLERHPDPEDHRRILLTLTAQGQEVLDRLSVLHRDELRRFHREMDDLVSTLEGAQGS